MRARARKSRECKSRDGHEKIQRKASRSKEEQSFNADAEEQMSSSRSRRTAEQGHACRSAGIKKNVRGDNIQKKQQQKREGVSRMGIIRRHESEEENATMYAQQQEERTQRA